MSELKVPNTCEQCHKEITVRDMEYHNFIVLQSGKMLHKICPRGKELACVDCGKSFPLNFSESRCPECGGVLVYRRKGG